MEAVAGGSPGLGMRAEGPRSHPVKAEILSEEGRSVMGAQERCDEILRLFGCALADQEYPDQRRTPSPESPGQSNERAPRHAMTRSFRPEAGHQGRAAGRGVGAGDRGDKGVVALSGCARMGPGGAAGSTGGRRDCGWPGGTSLRQRCFGGRSLPGGSGFIECWARHPSHAQCDCDAA